VAQDNATQSRARAWTWPVGGVRAPWGLAPRREFVVPARLREWAILEVAAGRLLPWFAVAYGLGIVVYFTAEREPAWWAATTLAAACAIFAVLLRRHVVAFIVALGLFGSAAGFGDQCRRGFGVAELAAANFISRRMGIDFMNEARRQAW